MDNTYFEEDEKWPKVGLVGQVAWLIHDRPQQSAPNSQECIHHRCCGWKQRNPENTEHLYEISNRPNDCSTAKVCDTVYPDICILSTDNGTCLIGSNQNIYQERNCCTPSESQRERTAEKGRNVRGINRMMLKQPQSANAPTNLNQAEVFISNDSFHLIIIFCC